VAERIGLTMRTMSPADYVEPRDCLARDWGRFMAAALPGVAWLPIPNLGDEAPAFAERWGLDGLLFTGGEDPGTNPVRDRTEAALLAWAMARPVGVFGVCRGLQVIQAWFGGPVDPCPGHAGTTHPVTVAGAIREVNSYHRIGVGAGRLAPPLRAFALSADGWVEGLEHPGAPLVAVQWHPERLPAPDPMDVQLLMRVFASKQE
jgi:putative glutamine amidotransferase